MKTWTEGEPLVSICCLTYNHGEYIAQALDSFLMQKTDFSYEILIHDDASPDGTGEILKEYAARYPDIVKPLIQEENQYSRGIINVSGAFNFPRARGKYICMCDGDDYWTSPDKLQMQVDYMEAHPDCSLCFHSAKTLVLDGSVTDRLVRPYRRSRRVEPGEMIDKASGYPTASLMFPAGIVEHLPEYYVNCPVGDTPLHLMAAAKGWGYYIDRPMCVYRVGVSTSWTAQGKQGDYEKKQRRYYEQMRHTYESFDRETGGRFHREAVSAARRVRFLTLVNTKKYGQVLRPEYRRYYRELNFRTRFFIRFEIMVPALYERLQNAVHRRRR